MVLQFGSMRVVQRPDGPSDWRIRRYSRGRHQMGQRAEIRIAGPYRPRKGVERTVLSVFPTELGWVGLVGLNDAVVRLSFGHAGPDEVRSALSAEQGGEPSVEQDWSPDLRKRLQDYATGAIDGFQDVPVALEGRTRFQRSVISALRRVGYGETVSYGELAELAGSPRSARAVGRVMATNRVPLVIACHRVLASGGALGGFSSPQGTAMKRRLLDLEGVEGVC